VTTEEIIERGLSADSLLSNPTFQSVLKGLTIEQFAVFTESKPDDKQAREDAYFLFQGLQAIEAELNDRVLKKDKAAMMLDAEREDQDDLDGPIYIQGNTDQ
jgi:hypothetical protein